MAVNEPDGAHQALSSVGRRLERVKAALVDLPPAQASLVLAMLDEISRPMTAREIERALRACSFPRSRCDQLATALKGFNILAIMPKPKERTMNDGDRTEMLDLSGVAHEWIDSLLVSGISEPVAVSAIQLALVERLLRAGGVDATKRWFGVQHALVGENGAAMLREMRREAN